METTRRSRDGLPGGRHTSTLPASRNFDKTFSRYGLSEREMTVLELISKGCSDREIAAALRVTPFTVNKHVGSILLKMDVRSRTAAAVHAIREHLFDGATRGKAIPVTG